MAWFSPRKLLERHSFFFLQKIMLFTVETNNLRVHFTNLARSGQKTPEVENTRNNIPLV